MVFTALQSCWPPGATELTLSGRPCWFTRTVILLALYLPAFEIWSPLFCHFDCGIQVVQAETLHFIWLKPVEQAVEKAVVDPMLESSVGGGFWHQARQGWDIAPLGAGDEHVTDGLEAFAVSGALSPTVVFKDEELDSSPLWVG